MQSLSEIDTTSKRASKAAGFSWGIAEEIGKADLQIAKHRNGSTGRIKLAFVGEYARFENLANEDQFQGMPDDHMDAAYNNNMANFDQEPF
jgi:replicative DNA helicase